MRGLRPALLFVPLTLMVLQSRSFELQDTIHALIEENIHLHDQLENLTQALRELKQMLLHHSHENRSVTRYLFVIHTDPDHHEHREHHGEEARHLWDEWSEHGISAETHLLLEHAFCGEDLHDSAAPLREEAPLRLLTSLCLALLLLMRCF